MGARLFDHIDLRVRNVAQARSFYDAFLPAAGFSEIRAGETWAGYSADDVQEKPPFIEINEAPGHQPNENRIALWADTEAGVDRLAAVVRAAGARVIEGPEYCHDYTPGYYAVFFEDADGNRWEVCCRTAPVRERGAAAAP